MDWTRPRNGWLIAVGCGALVAANTSLARATTFGIPLGSAPFNAAPGYTYDCSVYPTAIGPAPLHGPGGPASTATSCIWGDVPSPTEDAAFPGQNISLEPPGTGTVTQVRVGVGAQTGPMRVVVMRALYQNSATPGEPDDACCIPAAESRPFTPSPKSITNVAVNLPVREDATPPPDDLTTIADFDTLTLAVLEPGVPIPLYYTGTLSEPADFIWNTDTPSTVTPGFSTDSGGFFVAMEGQWTAGKGPGAAPPLDFGTGADPVNNGNAQIPLECAATSACDGTLQLENAEAPGAQRLASRDGARTASARLVSYGRRSFRIASGKRQRLMIRLSRTGKRLVSRHRTTTLWANVTLTTGVPGHYAFKLRLKRRG